MTTATFSCVRRPGTKYKFEWALRVSLNGEAAWVIRTWNYKPSERTLISTAETALICFKAYHETIRVPKFDLDINTINWSPT